MLKAVILFIVGLVLLIKGGDWFVDGASDIAHDLHIPELLIGATIVSIGTTLPEVMVSATSALAGHGELAYGNAIGSIICNTSLVAALTIAIKPAPVDIKELRTPVLFFFGTAAFYSIVAYATGTFTRTVGIVLILTFVAYITISTLQMKKKPNAEEPDEEIVDLPLWQALLYLVLGGACIAIGANLLVNNGTIIAQQLGVPESVIALTFVALGTSLPELVTAITSLAKGYGALSLGNVIGANLFNLVLVVGVSSALAPFPIPHNELFETGLNTSLAVEIPVMLGVMLILILPALIRKKLSRVQGIALLLIYACFCVFQFMM